MAIGARVPDSYQVATVTHHNRGSITVTSTVGGEVSMLLLPSPCLTMHTNAAGVPGLTAFTQNTSTYYSNTPAQIAAVLTEYRVVACGFRLISKDTATNTKGKVYVARVPTTSNAPSWNTLNTVTAASPDVIAVYLAGVTTTTPSLVMNMPGVRVFNMQDLLRGEVILSAVPTHESFYRFKGTFDRSVVGWNVGQVLADEGVFNSTTGLVNATAGGRKDVAAIDGGCAFWIWGTGLPGTSNAFDIEYVYHLEGVPNAAGTNLIPSAQRITTGTTTLVEQALSAASAANTVINYVTGGTAGAGTTALLFGLDTIGRLRSHKGFMGLS